MNKEEKEAIETLQGLCTDDCINKDVVQTVVNLIEKQQKEIKARLKEIDSLYKMMSVKDDEIEKLKEDYQILKDDIEGHRIAYVDTREFEEKYISKDKMKAKKEEYKKKCDECYFNKSRICKELKAYNCCSIQGALELLNELLGE